MSKLPDQSEISKAVHNPERLEAVRAVSASDRPSKAIFERLSRRASELLNTPVALISLVEEDADLIYGQTGLPEYIAKTRQIEAQPSFCQLTITAEEPVVINDAQKVPTLRLFPSVAKMGVRAHLGIPLQIDGQPVGNCCVIDFMPREWTQKDVAALSELASAAVREFAATVQPASTEAAKLKA
ncbi:MAG TPA: GAF domain-containing protein [Candidatus Saccharimonadia bacterium]|nr:GAF domain-containing protein [Candidatus Saccharimonadia bacterium]